MTFDADKAARLNADHHRRMASDSKRTPDSVRIQHRTLDTASRASIVRAMLGAVNRYDLSVDGPRVLELGAGRGGLKDALLEELGAVEYVGVEVVPEIAAVSDFVHAMPFEQAPDTWDGSFDFIFSRHVMEHVTGLPQAMRALKRLLAPKGVIGAVTPHYFPDPEPAHVTQLTISQWMAAYERNGFKCVYATEEHFTCAEAHLVMVHEEAVDL